MELSMQAALSGVNAAITNHNLTAQAIANNRSSAQKGIQVELSGAGTSIATTKEYENDLAQNMTDMISNKGNYSANLKVIKVQDRMLGEIIDLLA